VPDERDTLERGGPSIARRLLALVLAALVAYTIGQVARDLVDGWSFGPALAAIAGILFGLIALLAVRG
jgi:hypothetical protein